MQHKTLLILLIGGIFCFLPPRLAGDGAAVEIRKAHQREVIVACLILEAAGEGGEGMMAVMDVIANRAHRNPEDFFYQAVRPKQFSALNAAKGWPWRDFSAVVAKARRSPVWDIAEVIVDEAFSGNLPQLSNGATHYYASWMSQPPYWAASMEQSAHIGAHVFMRKPGNSRPQQRSLALAR